MENQFKVELGADDSQLRAALNESAKLLQNFTRQLQGLATTGKIDINTAPFQRAMKAGVALVDEFRTIAVDTAAKTQTSFQSITNSAESLETSLRSIPNAFDEVGASEAALQRINASIDASANSALQSSGKFQAFAQSIENSIAGFSATKESINQITASINRAGLAAIEAGENFLGLGVRMPIEDIKTLQGHVDRLQADIARGFKPIVNIVDPNTPVLLNRVSASLVNIGPAADIVNNALQNTGTRVERFGITVNKSLTDTVNQFDRFKTEALQLGIAFDQIPASLKPFNTSNIVAFRQALQELKEDIKGLQFKGALSDVQLPLAGINTLKKSVADLKKEIAIGTNVKITLNTNTITRTLANLQADLKNFKAQLQNATDPKTIQRLNNSIAQTNLQIKTLRSYGAESFGGIQRGAAAAAGSVNKLTPASKGAGAALGDLGRIAQDAPFGFIGIANNIDPLIQSFGRLKQETGSTGGALKALAGSLIGPAGLGFAVSAISSLVVVAIQKYGSLGNAMNVVFGLTSNLQQANRDLAQSMAQSAASAAGEIATIRSLVNIAKDKSLADNARQEAIDKLNAEYGEYLPKLNQENIDTKKVTTAVDELTKSLIRKAKIQGLQGLITKETERQADAFVRLQEQTSGTTTAVEDFVNALKAPAQGGNIGISNLVDSKKILSELDKSEERLKLFKTFLDNLLQEEAVTGNLFDEKTTKGGKEQDAVLKSLNQQLKETQTRIATLNKLRDAGQLPIHRENEALKLQLQLIETLGQIDAREVALKIKPKLEIDPEGTDLEIRQANEDYIKRVQSRFQVPIIVDPNVKVGTEGFFTKLQRAFLQSQVVRSLTGIELPVDIDLKVTSNVTEAFDSIKGDIQGIDWEGTFQPMVDQLRIEAEKAFDEVEANLKTITAKLELAPILSAGIGEAAEDAGAAIAKGGNPLTAAMEGFLHVLGAAISAFGKEIIAYGVAMLVAKRSIEASFKNPAVAIIAGTALTVLGGLLKNIKFDVPQFAEGGVAVGPSGGYLAMLHGKELITPLDRVGDLAMGGDFEPRVLRVETEGSKLIHVIEIAKKQQNRF